jgi:hypothetical protein
MAKKSTGELSHNTCINIIIKIDERSCGKLTGALLKIEGIIVDSLCDIFV